MNKHGKISFDQNELAASLVPLGICEITERMEVSPLLVDQGDLIQDENATICCTCKIPWEELDKSGNLPYPTVAPPMGAGGTAWPL